MLYEKFPETVVELQSLHMSEIFHNYSFYSCSRKYSNQLEHVHIPPATVYDILE